MAPNRRPADLDPDADRSDRRVPLAFPAVGELAGRYRVVRRLGSGSRGEVWLVSDGATGEPFALKSSPDAQALRDEWDCLLSLRGHPRFPRADRFYEGSHPDGPEREAFFTMEWIDGLTLDSALPEMNVRETRMLFVGACSGLAFMHDAGWIHGDVKPTNLLVRRECNAPQVHLIDFSLSRRIGKELAGWIRGTPQFAAPSILRGEPADRTSDIYSLGRSFLESASVAERDPELAGILQRMVEPEAGARFAAVSAILQEAEFLEDADRSLPGKDASRADPPFVDLGSRVEETLGELRRRLCEIGSGSNGEGLLRLGFDPGTGRDRFLMELRRRLLTEKIETVISPMNEDPAGHLLHAPVILSRGDRLSGYEVKGRQLRTSCLVLTGRDDSLPSLEEPSLEKLSEISAEVLGHEAARLNISAEMIARCTHGFVSWTVAAARALVEKGIQGAFPFELREVIGESLPENVKAFLKSRLVISAERMKTAGLLALAERPFTRAEAIRIGGDEVLWDELVEFGLLTIHGQAHPSSQPHASFEDVRDAILLASSLSAETRREGHAAWLRTVEHDGLGDWLPEFVHGLRCNDAAAILRAGCAVMTKALEGQRSSEAVRALDCIHEALPGPADDWLAPRDSAAYYELAGDVLCAHRSAEEALAMYGRIPACIENEGDRKLRLLRKRAVCFDALGDHQGAFDRLSAGVDDEADVSWKERVQAFERLGEFSCKLGDNVAAEEWLRKGLLTDGALPESLEVSCLWNNLGIVAGLRGETLASRTHHERALSIRETLGDEEGISRSLTNIAWADLRSGKLGSAEDRATRALEIKRRLGQLATATPAMSLLSEIHVRRGQFAEAIALTTESLHLREEAGHSEGEVSAQLALAELWFGLGRMGEAQRHSDSGLVILARTGLRRSYLPASLLFRARLEAALGRGTEAVRLAREVTVEAERTDSEEYSISARSLLVVLTQASEIDPSEAARLEERSLCLPEGSDRIAALLDVAEACLSCEELQRALRVAKRACQEAQELQVESMSFRARLIEAKARLALGGDETLAAKLLHEAALGAERLGLLELRWQSYLTLADMHDRAGRSDRALGWLGRCTEVFSQVVQHLEPESMVDDYLGAPDRVRILEALESRLSPDASTSDSLGAR